MSVGITYVIVCGSFNQPCYRATSRDLDVQEVKKKSYCEAKFIKFNNKTPIGNNIPQRHIYLSKCKVNLITSKMNHWYHDSNSWFTVAYFSHRRLLKLYFENQRSNTFSPRFKTKQNKIKQNQKISSTSIKLRYQW